MPPHSVDNSQRNAARVFGLTYLPAFVLVAAVNFAILQPLITGSDPDSIAGNILAHATLFRVGALGFLLYCVATLVISAVLYVILRPLSRSLALLSTLARFVHGLSWLLVALNLFTALRLLSRPEFMGLPPDEQAVLARLYLSGFDQYYVGLLFWSLATTIFSYLMLRSWYVPRALAGFGFAASVWCAGCTLALLVFPEFSRAVNLWLFDIPMVLFEIGVSLWLLIRGLRAPETSTGSSESHS